MSFMSFLKTVGRDFEKGLGIGIRIAQAATPIIALAQPEVAPLYTAVTQTVAGAVIQTEQKFAAMNKQDGTGSQKLAEVLQIVTPAVTQVLGSAGVKVDDNMLSNWVNAVVALLNALPPLPVVNPPAPPSQ